MSEDLTKDRRLPKSIRWILLFGAVIAALAGAVKAVIEVWPKPPSIPCKRLDRPADPGAIGNSTRTAQPARCSLERGFELWRDGKPAALAEVFIAASPELRQLESRLLSKTKAATKAAGTVSLYFVHAPAGSGKTPLMDYFREKSGFAFVDLGVYRNELKAGSSKWAARETELRLIEKEVSWQPKLTASALEGGLEAFVKRVTGSNLKSSKGLLIDNLDEVHPDSSLQLLNSIKQYSIANPKRVIVVAGRGEAFRDYFVQNELRSVQEIRLPTLYVADDPMLTWYVDDYVAYKSGSSTPDPARRSELLNALRGLIKGHPFTRHFMYPGALGNFAIENVRYSDQNDRRLEALMFQTLIDRNKRTHNRPAKDDDISWKLYKDALIQIARRYKPNAETGVFLVGTEDVVCVTDGQSFAEVNVGRVLMRSGLVDLTPVNVRYLEFMFWPRNLHALLATGALE